MQYALWYWQHHSPYYDLFDTEEEAASFAVSMEDHGEGSVVGLQRSDGTCVRQKDWVAYKAESDRRIQEWREESARRAAEPPRPTRTVAMPFDQRDGSTVTVKVDAEDPSWIGRPL